ncbi:hypothetical protein MHYP_G00192170 [Metynnis hypsauchen]
MEHLDTTGQHLDTTPHWPPVISAAKKAKRQLFLEELERAQAAQAKQKPAPPTRGTLYRRKKTEEEDKKILQEAGRQVPARLPCNLCGQPKRLEFGHMTYMGKSV